MAEPSRRGPLLFLVVFGAVFALLGLLLAAIVVGSSLRTSASPPDQDAREGWMLLAGLAVVVASATFFGLLFRLPLAERRLGRPVLALEPATPVAGQALRVVLQFAPPFGLRLQESWVEIVPPEGPAVRASLHAGTRNIAPGTETRLEVVLAVPPAGARLVTIYVGIGFWPDWRVDLPF